MNDSIFRISLDIHEHGSQAVLKVKQGDTGRQLRVSLSDGGTSYIITDGCYAAFKATKPDGTILYNDCHIDGNEIVYEFTEQTCIVVGRCRCEIALYGRDDKLITSPRFALLVDGTIYSDEKVVSDDEFTALTAMVSNALEAIDEANKAAAGADTAAENARLAERRATAAAEDAEAAAAFASKATQNANNAANIASQEAGSANEAAGRANAAAELANGAANRADEAATSIDEKLKDIEDGSSKTILTEADFAIGRINASGAYASDTDKFAATPNLLECTVDKPFHVTANGDSTLTVGYYGKDGTYISRASGLTKADLEEDDNVCNRYTGAQEDIAYVRFVINYLGQSIALTQADLAAVVAQFTFAQYYNDPIARQSDIATLAKNEDVDYYSSANRIPTRAEYNANGLKISTTDEQGKYVINGKSTLTKALTVALYDDLHSVPGNILRGHSYKIGKRFPSGVNMIVYESCDGETLERLGTATGTKSADIKISENAVGLRIALTIGHEYNFADDVIETELISVESGKYWADKNHPYVPTPPPMLTIIDDDGNKRFHSLLMEIVKDKKIPIGSSIPVKLIETRPAVTMTWEQIEDCAKNGAEMLSHTYSNLTPEDVREVTEDPVTGKKIYGARRMTDRQIDYDYRLAQAHLRHHGIHCEGLVFVGDTSNIEECVDACKRVYRYGFKANCRVEDETTGQKSTAINFRGQTDRYNILRNGATPRYQKYKKENGEIVKDENNEPVLSDEYAGYTQEELEKDITVLKEAGTGWLVWMVHTSVEGEFGQQQKNVLANAIQHAINKGIQIVSTEYGVRTYCD